MAPSLIPEMFDPVGMGLRLAIDFQAVADQKGHSRYELLLMLAIIWQAVAYQDDQRLVANRAMFDAESYLRLFVRPAGGPC